MIHVATDGTEFDLDTLSPRQRRTVLALIASGDLKPKPPVKKPTTSQKKD